MVKFLKQKLSPLSFLVGLLLILLISLATLQYRWLARASVGERELMKAGLKVKARSFCKEFDSEITRAFSTFKMDADTLRNIDQSQYAERYNKWLNLASHPRIVKNIFLARADENGQFHLLRLDETARRFVITDWTIELEDLRRRFEQQSNIERKDFFNGGADSIVEEIPALVSSIVSFKPNKTKSNFREIDWEHPLGYVIVALDLDYIKDEFIPALAKRYFLSGDTLDYNLTVLSRSDTKKIIYQSSAEKTYTTTSSNDASDNMLNISFDEVRKFSSERIYETSGSPNQENSSFTMVIPATEETEADTADKVLLVNDSARWELRVNHRAGSLNAAVTNAHWWNMMTSFGILHLLAMSIVLIIILSRRAQRLAQRQMEFVAGVSHEFRTPLAVIHSLSENLAAGRINDNGQVRNYGATIRKDVRRLTEMVEQVLEFSGAERGKHFYDITPLDINILIEKVLAANASLLEEDGWTVEKDIELNLPLVKADESALSRAIQNLLSNAIKYSNDNRWLRIKAYKNIISQKQELHISIEDKGVGIPSFDLPHIFEPFYRGREVVDAQIHGNGLGLSLVKQIVEAHGGKVTVEGAHGRGSRFTLHLPL